MATSHVVGGGSAALIGAVAVSLVNHFFHSHVSDADAIVIGAAAVSAGAGFGHVVEQVGIFGAFRHLLHGAAKPAPVEAPVAAPVFPDPVKPAIPAVVEPVQGAPLA